MLSCFAYLTALAWFSGAYAQLQVPFKTGSLPSINPQAGDLNTTTLTLNALTDDYTVLGHPEFPNHSVRIRKADPEWCETSAASYTGYIDTSAARHIFFYFFESRNDPDSDDVILWTNGGPGCSSSLGLFMELGPCRINDTSGPKHHPYSWNEHANVFFIDQPIGVGFSYADYGEFVSTTEEAAGDIAAFVAIFFASFSKFSGRGFHMAGESYGGRYIPVYASAVYEQNAVLKVKGNEPINLKSIMIGNGFTDFYHQIPSFYDILCTPASIEPFIDIPTCVRMKTALPRCKKWMKESCVDTFDAMSCKAAMNFCEAELGLPMLLSGKNVYDMSRDCEGPIEETLCYPVTKHISEYLNRPRTRKLLGVSSTLANMTFTSCSSVVGYAFRSAMDDTRVQTQFYLEGLLDRGVDVLIYIGTYDWGCNWVGNLRMVDSLEWKDSDDFKKQTLKPWSVGGNDTAASGRFKSSGGLTFLTVEGAGHMVPYDKPVEALDMVRTWLSGKNFR